MDQLTISDISVKVRLLNKPSILAQAELIILDQIEIKGWRVSESKHLHSKFQEHIWIQPPSYKSGYKYKPVVYTSDKNLYSQIEEKIYNTYCQEKTASDAEESLGAKVANDFEEYRKSGTDV